MLGDRSKGDMIMRTRTETLNDIGLPSAHSNSSAARLGFRTALVIEESENLRRSMVDHLKKRGWIVHGVRRVKQALPVLRHIPYHLVLVGCELTEMTVAEFARVISESDKGQGIHLVALTGTRDRSSAADFSECGAFLAERSKWKHDVSNYLADIESGDSAMAQFAL